MSRLRSMLLCSTSALMLSNACHVYAHERRQAAVHMQERAREVADDLMGTCRMLNEFATAEEESSAEFCAELDSHVFQCVTCSWWFEPGELRGDDECEDCCDGAEEED